MLEGSDEGEVNALAISKTGEIFASGKIKKNYLASSSN